MPDNPDLHPAPPIPSNFRAKVPKAGTKMAISQDRNTMEQD